MPKLMDRVDLLMLSVKSPMTDAVCATVCSRWSEAVDLWLDVYRVPPYRALSAWCGLEAALRAGFYDLAQYFLIKSNECSALPEFLGESWRESLPIRRNRTRFYSGQIQIGRTDDFSRGEMHGSTRHLVEMRLYREAIREIFRRRLHQTDVSAAVPLLAACYCGLGEHEALIALHRSRRLYFGGRGVRSMLKNARTCLFRAREGPVENMLRFTASHPAGALLIKSMKAPECASATHG